MKSIEEAKIEKGQKVIIRCDWNLPTDKDGNISDTSRVEITLPTIRLVSKQGGIPIIISHFGRKGASLRQVYEYFTEKFSEFTGVFFIEDPFSEESKIKIKSLNPGEVAVIENIRKWNEEEENNEEFGKKLASLADFYVNDAFSNSHREHASMVQIPKFLPHFAGLRLLEEFNKISEAFNPAHPFLFILGGAKFETKIPLVEKFLGIADYIFIGGANAATAAKHDIAKNPKIMLPVGDVAALDANPETLEMLREIINQSKFVLWNGPLGKYEDGFIAGTAALARILAESGVKVITGGGDTENVIDDLHLEDKFYFISLAGGAMLEFLAIGTLPALEALK